MCIDCVRELTDKVRFRSAKGTDCFARSASPSPSGLWLRFSPPGMACATR